MGGSLTGGSLTCGRHVRALPILRRARFLPLLRALRVLMPLLLVPLPFAPLRGHAQEGHAADEPPPRVTVTSSLPPEKISYRVAYRMQKTFAGYAGRKDLLVPRMVLYPRHPGENVDGLALRLVGMHHDIPVPVDAAFSAAIPVDDAAYADAADLVLNRPGGHFRHQHTVFLAERPGHVYDAAGLREACRQAYAYFVAVSLVQRVALAGKQCAGIQFLYPRDHPDPRVSYAGEDGNLRPVTELSTVGKHRLKVATYRFDGTPAEGPVRADDPPAGITPLFE